MKLAQSLFIVATIREVLGVPLNVSLFLVVAQFYQSLW